MKHAAAVAMGVLGAAASHGTTAVGLTFLHAAKRPSRESQLQVDVTAVGSGEVKAAAVVTGTAAVISAAEVDSDWHDCCCTG